jgi:hypothetical protein
MTPEEERDYQEVIRRTKEKFMAHQNIDRRREMVGRRKSRTWTVGSNGTEKAVKRRPQPDYAAGAARL